MKKFLALVLALAFCVCIFAACNGDKESETTTGGTTVTPVTTTVKQTTTETPTTETPTTETPTTEVPTDTVETLPSLPSVDDNITDDAAQDDFPPLPVA